MPTRPVSFLIAVALVDDSPAPNLARWSAQARAAEDAGVDFVTIDAGPADSLLVAAAVAATTKRVGIVPAVTTTITEPFHVSTGLATVDEISHGRAGWLAGVIPADQAQGQVTWTVAEDVHADAAEHVDAVRALWDSWEDGAVIRDASTARFLDRARLHHVDLRGEHFSIRGPSITPRPPQGNPPIFARVRSADALALVRAWPDVLVSPAAPTPPALPGGSAAIHIRELDCGADLAARVAAARDAGSDGVLVHPQDLGRTLSELAPVIAARAAEAPVRGRAPSLRAQLGLAEAVNRFTAAHR